VSFTNILAISAYAYAHIADEKKFIQGPIVWQFSQDNLVIPEKE
jgi:hypothetical protein